MLSSADHEMILDATFQIIDSCTNSEAILNEACSLSKKMKLDGRISDSQHYVDNFLSLTCQANQPSGTEKGGIFTAPALAKQIIDITKYCHNDDCALLSQSTMEKFKVILNLLRSVQDHSFNKKLFTSMVWKHELPVEIAWNLNKVGVMNLDTYLREKLMVDKQLQERLSSELTSLCSGKPETLGRRQEILSGFTSVLMRKGYGEGKAVDKMAFVQILDDVLHGILGLGKDNNRGSESLALPTDVIMLEINIPKRTLKKFSMHALSTVLSYGEKLTVSDCLKSDREWTKVPIFGIVRALLKQLLLPVEFEDATGILTRYLDQGQINGTAVLIFLSVLHTSFPESARFLQAHIKDELTAGLETSDNEKLSTAFLLARQNAVVGQLHDFPGYGNWYQSVFGENNLSPATTRPTFTCLIKFLSSLVPTESSEYLKVHIMKRPYIPSKCKDIYEDYIILAKTRLQDLKVPLTDLGDGIYGDAKAGESSKGSRLNKNSEDVADKDVEKTLESYKETRKIPTALIEASIFRRPYFMGKFLPALLKPRHLPDQPDLKMMLIEELKNSGKIPPPMFKRYLEDCEKEKQTFLEGVFDLDDEDDVDEMVLSPADQLVRRLDKYRDVLCKGEEDKVSDCLLQVREKVSEVLTSVLTSETPESITGSPVPVDLTKPQPGQGGEPLAQAVRAVTVCLSQLIDQWLESAQCQLDHGERLLRGAMALMSMLLGHFPLLVQKFCFHVLNKFSKQQWSQEMTGVALVCVSLLSVPGQGRPQLVLTHTHCRGRRDIHSCGLDTVLSALSHCDSPASGRSLEFSLRFCLLYLRIVFGLLDAEQRALAEADVVEIGNSSVTEEHLIPGQTVKRVQWLVRRYGLVPGLLRSGVAVSSRSSLCEAGTGVFSQDRWQPICTRHKLLLQEWVEFELTVDPGKDSLSGSERLTMMWEFSSYFLNHSEYTGKLDRLCGDLLTALVESMMRGGDAVQENSVCTFVQLLRQLLLQMAPCRSSNSSWLLLLVEHTAVTSYRKDTLMRLLMDLPHYLLFCNSLHEKITRMHVDVALSVLGHLATSSYARETGLTLDATMYCIQSYLHAKNNATEESDLVPFETHPLITVSVLRHKKILEDLGLFSQLRLSWSSALSSALLKAKSPHYCHEDLLMEPKYAVMLEGTALFVKLVERCENTLDNDTFSSDFVSTGKTSKMLLYFLELVVIYLTRSGQWSKDTQWDRDSVLVKAFSTTLSHNKDLWCPLLDPDHRELSEFRRALGIVASSHCLAFLRDLSVLRLSMQVSAQQVLGSAGPGVTLAVVDTYKRCLLYTRDHGMDNPQLLGEVCHSRLTTWIKCLIDNTSRADLQAIKVPRTAGVGEEVLLFRYIEEKKKGWI